MDCVKAQRTALLFPQTVAISVQMLGLVLGLRSISGAAGTTTGAADPTWDAGSERPAACPLWAGAQGAAAPTRVFFSVTPQHRKPKCT